MFVGVNGDSTYDNQLKVFREDIKRNDRTEKPLPTILKTLKMFSLLKQLVNVGVKHAQTFFQHTKPTNYHLNMCFHNHVKLIN